MNELIIRAKENRTKFEHGDTLSEVEMMQVWEYIKWLEREYNDKRRLMKFPEYEGVFKR